MWGEFESNGGESVNFFVTEHPECSIVLRPERVKIFRGINGKSV